MITENKFCLHQECREDGYCYAQKLSKENRQAALHKAAEKSCPNLLGILAETPEEIDLTIPLVTHSPKNKS